MTHLDRRISTNLAILFSMIPGIRDGHPDAVHDARVATRRLRAALPLAWAGSPETLWQDGSETIRELGRALGRVREFDVAVEQLASLQARLPQASAAIAELRMHLGQQQWAERRRLIKVLEQPALDPARALALVPARRLSLRLDRRWRAVESAIVEHSEDLGEAVTSASGVYFPNRAHRVRVEMKKLRYVLELVPHEAAARTAVKRLKRTQELLGQLHDHQALRDIASAAKCGDKTGRRSLLAFLDAACQDLFQQYLAHRPRILEICREARAAGARGAWRPASLGGTLLTAGAVAAPSAFLFLSRRSERHAAAKGQRGSLGSGRAIGQSPPRARPGANVENPVTVPVRASGPR